MDPLDFTITTFNRHSLSLVKPSENAKIRVSALIEPQVIEALRAIRRTRRISEENTEVLLGALLTEYAQTLTTQELGAKAVSPETPATKAARWALASNAVNGVETLTRAQISAQALISYPTTALAVKSLLGLGLLVAELGRNGTRPVEVYRLTLKGIAASEKDHPDESARFILGGMLPEPINPRLGPWDPVAGTWTVVPPTPQEGARAVTERKALVEGEPNQFWKAALERVAKSSGSEDE